MQAEKTQEDEEAMTGLELGEIQVGQAVLFVLGLAVGLAPLWREPYTRNTVSCFGKALFFWFSFFNTYHFAAGLEKAGVQKWGSEVRSVTVPSPSEGKFSAPQGQLRPWSLRPPCPSPDLHPRPPG